MKNNGRKLVLTLLIVVVLAALGSALFLPQAKPVAQSGNEIVTAQLKTFASMDELKGFLKNTLQQPNYGYLNSGFGGVMKATVMAESATAPSASDAGSSDYSTTNIQVAGVDEADFVKNDGKYIYTIDGNKLVIVDAYPAENAKIASETELKGTPVEMFVNKDKLVVFARDYERVIQPETTQASIGEMVKPAYYPYYGSNAITRITVYDISSRENPVVAREITLSGDYSSSRMIDDYVYAIANMPAYYYENGPIPVPMITENGVSTTLAATDIYYFPQPDYGYSYTNILAVNTQDDTEKHSEKTFLGSGTQNIYVSEGNIYLTNIRYSYNTESGILRTAAAKASSGVSNVAAAVGIAVPAIMPVQIIENETTIIQKIAISGGSIEYKGQGSVPGHVLNQFSMDEYNGYFRIATTTGQVWGSEPSSKNHIYVLDENLNTVGRLEDLAPGEKIYSARFMGNRVYLVTFQKVDPLFVIDLSQPENPKVLGRLKIPGYSDYLHPYDETHIIGIGKEALPSEQGNFAWYQGMKIALFDVSDPENPKEVSNYQIGDRGTDSYALQDHKAFLFSKEKNLLVIPVLLAEIDKSRYAEGELPAYAYGDYVWQGAYVFSIDTENGLQLKGRISHLNASDDSLLKSGYYYSSEYSIKRSLYMDNVLYTVSDKMIKMNSLDGLAEVNSVELPVVSYNSYGYEIGIMK